MRIDYPDNSFMLSWQKCRAWYTSEGVLKDCEYKRWRNGYPAACNISHKHTKVRAWLEKQGQQEAKLLNDGILKREIQRILKI